MPSPLGSLLLLLGLAPAAHAFALPGTATRGLIRAATPLTPPLAPSPLVPAAGPARLGAATMSEKGDGLSTEVGVAYAAVVVGIIFFAVYQTSSGSPPTGLAIAITTFVGAAAVSRLLVPDDK